MKLLYRFKRDTRGSTALIFGLSLVPLIGFAGAAIDYSRASSFRAAMQKAADAAAMQKLIAEHNRHSIDLTQTFLANLSTNLPVRDMRVTGAWIGPDQFRVEAEGAVPTTLTAVFVPSVEIGVVAVAQRSLRNNRTRIERTNLSPEAADYNELQAYCYNEVRNERLGPLKNEFSNERLPFVKIADNSPEGVLQPPREFEIICGQGEQMSFYLKNVRNARTSPARRLTGETWNHYTDTTSGPDGELKFNLQYRDMLETIMCDTRAQCVPQSQGGILPNGMQRHRMPAVNRRACEEGKFLAFGFEDRPPYIGWTDQDYDDIRIVINCPVEIQRPLDVRLVL